MAEMARIEFGAVPTAPDRYDRANEAEFRRAFASLQASIDEVMGRLKTSIEDGAVLLTGDQTIAGNKTFSDNIVSNGTIIRVNADPSPATFEAIGRSAQLLLDETDGNRWRVIAFGGGNCMIQNLATDTHAFFLRNSSNQIPLLMHMAAPASGNTAVQIGHNANGSEYTTDTISVGAADSGGTGFRVLRIPN